MTESWCLFRFTPGENTFAREWPKERDQDSLAQRFGSLLVLSGSPRHCRRKPHKSQGMFQRTRFWKPGSASHLSRQSCQAPVDTTWQKHSIKTFAQVVSARNVRQNFLKGEGSCSALVQCLGEVQYQVCVQPFSLVGLQCSTCLLYTSPSPRDGLLSRMPSSA